MTKGICCNTGRTWFKKGNQLSKGNPPNKGCFKKGFTPWNKGKKGYSTLKKGKKFPQFSGKKHPLWKGGKFKDRYGYILIYKPKHPFAQDGRYIPEHRLVIEKQIGRYLLSKEEGHHLSNIKDDNRPKNLMAFVSKSAHRRYEKGGQVNPSEIIFDGRKFNPN